MAESKEIQPSKVEISEESELARYRALEELIGNSNINPNTVLIIEGMIAENKSLKKEITVLNQTPAKGKEKVNTIFMISYLLILICGVIKTFQDSAGGMVILGFCLVIIAGVFIKGVEFDFSSLPFNVNFKSSKEN